MQAGRQSLGSNRNMLKTAGSSEVPASKAIEASADEVVDGGGGGSGVDGTVENSSKSRKSNHFTKLSRSSQRSIQALIR